MINTISMKREEVKSSSTNSWKKYANAFLYHRPTSPPSTCKAKTAHIATQNANECFTFGETIYPDDVASASSAAASLVGAELPVMVELPTSDDQPAVEVEEVVFGFALTTVALIVDESFW